MQIVYKLTEPCVSRRDLPGGKNKNSWPFLFSFQATAKMNSTTTATRDRRARTKTPSIRPRCFSKTTPRIYPPSLLISCPRRTNRRAGSPRTTGSPIRRTCGSDRPTSSSVPSPWRGRSSWRTTRTATGWTAGTPRTRGCDAGTGCRKNWTSRTAETGSGRRRTCRRARGTGRSSGNGCPNRSTRDSPGRWVIVSPFLNLQMPLIFSPICGNNTVMTAAALSLLSPSLSVETSSLFRAIIDVSLVMM